MNLTDKPDRRIPMTAILNFTFTVALALNIATSALAAGGNTKTESLTPVIQKGDRIVFLGDSITEQSRYTNVVEAYLVSRFPGAGLTFFNAGWSGDDSYGADTRIERDVLALNPSLVTICFGMNDGWYMGWTEGTGTYFTENMTRIITKLRAKGVRIAFLTPGITDAKWLDEINYNDTMRHMADTVIAIAKKENIPVFDNHALLSQVQKAGKKKSRKFNIIDEGEIGIHPQAPGGLVMAYGMLKALGVPDRKETVTAAAVDAAKGAYTFKLAALPYFVQPDARPALEYIPFMQEFNSVTLKFPVPVAKPCYLTFAGENHGRILPASAVRDGIDLATFWDTPVMDQAEWINTFTAEKNTVFYKFWRTLGMKGNFWVGAEMNPELQKAGINASLRLEELRNPELAPPAKGYEFTLRVFETANETVADGGKISVWSAVGPFSGKKKKPISSETDFTSSKKKLKDGWKTIVINNEKPNANLSPWLGGKGVSAYLFTVIDSPVAQKAVALVGIDDACTIWLNGKKAGSFGKPEKFEADKYSVKLGLKKGANRLLILASNDRDDFSFSMKFTGLVQPVSSIPPTLETLVKEAGK
jgi:lysophospholipase L1-like esterase